MRIGIVGCAGRMGRALVQEVCATAGCELAGGSARAGSPAVGEDVAALAGLKPAGLKVGTDAAALFKASDAVIDFTVPAAAAAHAALAAAHGVALVLGTSGLEAAHRQALQRAAKQTAIVEGTNMSVGVNLLLNLTGQVAAILGDDYDVEIFELFHRTKVDVPSATALALGQAAARARGVDLEAVAVKGRDGHVGPRRRGAIGFVAMRGGDSPGEHTVIFAGPGERVELTHRASSRAIYSKGAVRAALWTQGKAPGLYSMADVLGLA